MKIKASPWGGGLGDPPKGLYPTRRKEQKYWTVIQSAHGILVFWGGHWCCWNMFGLLGRASSAGQRIDAVEDKTSRITQMVRANTLHKCTTAQIHAPSSAPRGLVVPCLVLLLKTYVGWPWVHSKMVLKVLLLGLFTFEQPNWGA